MSAVVLNAFASCDVQEMSELLLALCGTGLTQQQESFMQRQVKALAPALVFMRDEGKMEVNALVIAQCATEGGFLGLSTNQSLRDDLREACAAMHHEMVQARLRSEEVLVALLRW